MEYIVSNYDLIVIGGSAGSIECLIKILSDLPENLQAAILITIHVDGTSVSNLPEVLSRQTNLPVRYAESGERIIPGCVYVAVPDFHLVVIDGHLLLRGGPKVNRHRPAIDPLFRSAAQRHGNRVIGLLLSGMLDDGTVGMLEIGEYNGWTIVQDPNDAQFSNMPQSAIEHANIKDILPTSQIAIRLKELVQDEVIIVAKPYTKEPTINITSLEDILLREITEQPGEKSEFSCPECGASLWKLSQEEFTRFRCHIGHSFTSANLIEKQTQAIEMYQWQLLRVLKERYEMRGQLIKAYRKSNKIRQTHQIEHELEKDKIRLDILERELGYDKSFIMEGGDQ